MYSPSNEIIHLVSIPSKLNNNLSLLRVDDEYSNAELLTVVHGDYVNLIPLNDNSIHGRYIPLCQGKQRGNGTIREAKWLNIQGESYLIILSNIGIQIYRLDSQQPICTHECLEDGDGQGYVQGVCCVSLHYLCIGSSMGTIWIFKLNNARFEYIKRQFAHSGPIIYLAGNENYCVSSGMDKRIIIWRVHHGIMDQYRELNIHGPKALSTSIIFSNENIICGYDTGEISVFNLLDTEINHRYVAHKLNISAMDFANLKNILLTTSEDSYIKIWKYVNNNLELKFEIETNEGPLVGAQFFNRNATEFGVVSLHSTKVVTYIQNDDENDDFNENNNYNHNISGIFELEQSDDEENGNKTNI